MAQPIGRHARVDGMKAPSGRVPLFARFATAALIALAAVIVTGLAIAAPLVSGYFTNVIEPQVTEDALVLLTAFGAGLFISCLIPLVILAVLVCVLALLWRGLRRAPSAPVIAVSLALILAGSLAWVLLLRTQTNIYVDSMRLDTYARALLEQKWWVFTKDVGDQGISYLKVYPFQSGSIWLLAGIYTLFGVGNQVPFQVLGVLCSVLAAASLIFICARVFRDRATVNASCVLLVLFLPLMFSAALVYGNAIGFGLACAALALHVEAMRRTDEPVARWVLFGIGWAVLALSLMVKSTFVLLLIALVLAWAIVLVRERRLPLILVVLISAFVVNKLSGVPVHLLEAVVGASFGDGMPKTSWIAMGLTWDDFLDNPGWWAPEQAVHFASVDGDTALQGAYAMDSIKDSLASFVADPLWCIQFFAIKLATEWLEPTFQSLYYSATSVSDDTATLVAHAIYSGHFLNRDLIMFMDAFQTLYYACAATGLICAFRHRRELAPGALVPLISFLGGVACYLLWEAKSVYAMPFALLLIPFAAYGLRSLLELPGRIMGGVD